MSLQREEMQLVVEKKNVYGVERVYPRLHQVAYLG